MNVFYYVNYLNLVGTNVFAEGASSSFRVQGFHENRGRTLLLNDGIYEPKYEVSYPRRQHS